MIVALQLIAGRPSVWLPQTLIARSMDSEAFAKIVRYSLPWVERIERMARWRLWPGAMTSIGCVIGFACLVMALFLFMPIPFANGVPTLAIIAL